MKVLIIDDDARCGEPLVWRLKRESYEVTYCKSVEDVLDKERKLKVQVPDLILLDIMMPHGKIYTKHETDSGAKTGLRLLEDIQKVYPKIPVFIITVHLGITLAELRKKFGDNVKGILLKPITPTQVVKKLKEHFIRKN